VDKGVPRVGSRLNNADILQESKYPFILPHKGNVTVLNIRDAHECLHHAGHGHVQARLHEKYWKVGAKSTVCQLISSCVICCWMEASSGPDDDWPAKGSTDTRITFHMHWCSLFRSIYHEHYSHAFLAELFTSKLQTCSKRTASLTHFAV